MSNAQVSGGGSSETNGLYIKQAWQYNGKDAWSKDGSTYILWYGSYWVIEYASLAYYISFSSTANPWTATGWFRSSGINPPPTVTEVPVASANTNFMAFF